LLKKLNPFNKKPLEVPDMDFVCCRFAVFHS
jgi:hypothetical protein